MTNESQIDDKASKKEKFNLSLEMLKGYHDGLESRVEKSTALLMIVLGWLLTSDTARKSLANNEILFWGGIITLTILIIMYCLNVYHFLRQFRKIEEKVNKLDYIDQEYLVRYKMPETLFGLPILSIYLAPGLVFYIFILILLFLTKYGFL